MPVVEILRGLFRKLVRIDGSTRPMGGPNTTVPPWMSTPVYDPLNGEVIAGVDGPERIQLAADGKLYPPLCTGGYPPAKTAMLSPSAQTFFGEIVVAAAPGGAILSANNVGDLHIFVPTGASCILTGNGGATVLGPGSHYFGMCRGQIQAAAGVASCYYTFTLNSITGQTAQSR